MADVVLSKKSKSVAFKKTFACVMCMVMSAVIGILSFFSVFSVGSVALEGDFFVPFYSAQTVSARDTLCDFEKEIFDTITGSVPGKTEFVFDTIGGEDIRYKDIPDNFDARLFWAVLRDCPYMFWFDGLKFEVKTKTGEDLPTELKTYTVTVILETNAPDSKPFNTDYKALCSVVESLDFEAETRYELLMCFHDYLCENITYNKSLEEDECISNEVNDRKHGILGALCDGKAACQGYAKAFKFLCDMYKIPCITVCSEGHMWNGVLMDDGCWYYVDVFGDDVNNSYEYFLVGDYTEDENANGKYFCETHENFAYETSPEAVFSEYSYEITALTGFSLSKGYCESDSKNHLILSAFDANGIIYYNGLAVGNSTATGSKFTLNDGTKYTCVLLGDLNGDGECDSNDFSAVLSRALTGMKVNRKNPEDLAADIDRDGVIDALDAAQIERAVSGSDTNLL